MYVFYECWNLNMRDRDHWAWLFVGATYSVIDDLYVGWVTTYCMSDVLQVLCFLYVLRTIYGIRYTHFSPNFRGNIRYLVDFVPNNVESNIWHNISWWSESRERERKKEKFGGNCMPIRWRWCSLSAQLTTNWMRFSIWIRTGLEGLRQQSFNELIPLNCVLFVVQFSGESRSPEQSSAMYNGEYQPLPEEFLAVGIFGLMLFSSIILTVAYLQSHSKTLLNRLFYLSLGLTAVLELPRYSLMVKDKGYSSTSGYASHILAGVFFFICLAIIAKTFADILELGALSKMIYGKKGLTIAVIVHIAVDLSAFIYCCQAQSLGSFFESIYYRFYVIFDITQNIFYSCVLTVFGLRLIFRWEKSEQLKNNSLHQKECYLLFDPTFSTA